MILEIKPKYVIIYLLVAGLGWYNIYNDMKMKSNLYNHTFEYEKEQQILTNISYTETKEACKDYNGYSYSAYTNISFHNSNYSFDFTCRSQGHHYYAWELKNIEYKFFDPTIVAQKSGGCVDQNKRIYPLGYKITDSYTFTCSVKNDKFYWLVKK